MNFEKALEALKDGKRVTNNNWNGKDMYLEAQFPDENSKMSLPYIYIKNATGDLVPWLCSQMDLFSEEWEIVSVYKIPPKAHYTIFHDCSAPGCQIDPEAFAIFQKNTKLFTDNIMEAAKVKAQEEQKEIVKKLINAVEGSSILVTKVGETWIVIDPETEQHGEGLTPFLAADNLAKKK